MLEKDNAETEEPENQLNLKLTFHNPVPHSSSMVFQIFCELI